MSDHILQRPKDFLERLVRSNGSTPSTHYDKDVVVITCSDPRIADVVANMDAIFVRIPGVEAHPSWNAFQTIMRPLPLAVLFLCHNQCLAHGGILERTQDAAQRSCRDFRAWFGRAGGAFLVGRVDVETRHVTFLNEENAVLEPEELLHTIPIHSGVALQALLDLNWHRAPTAPRGTTLLHPPVGVLAISVAGTLKDMHERNLAYVLDYVGQSEVAFFQQVHLLGNAVLINVPRPHLCVVSPAAEERLARRVFSDAVDILNDVGGNCFTAELVIRHEDGDLEPVIFFETISARASQSQ